MTGALVRQEGQLTESVRTQLREEVDWLIGLGCRQIHVELNATALRDAECVQMLRFLWPTCITWADR